MRIAVLIELLALKKEKSIIDLEFGFPRVGGEVRTSGK
jgi:hypothetical protein